MTQLKKAGGCLCLCRAIFVPVNKSVKIIQTRKGGILLKKARIYVVSLALFAGIFSCGNIFSAEALPVYQSKKMAVATDANAEYEKLEEIAAEPVLMRQNRTSDVLTITGSGVEEKMAGSLGKPGVYLLFQGAEYRHGFNEMISNHTTEGTSRQIDGIWEYYKKNEKVRKQ